MAKCKCKYFRRDDNGVLVCSVCGEPAPGWAIKNEIEDKVIDKHETKEV